MLRYQQNLFRWKMHLLQGMNTLYIFNNYYYVNSQIILSTVALQYYIYNYVGMLLERLVYILRIMTGGSHVARWCPKRTIAKCQECLQVIRLHLNFNILYGKRCKGLIIVDQNKLTLTNIIDRIIFFS